MTCMTSGRRRSGEAAASRLHMGPLLSSVSPAWKPLKPVQLLALIRWSSRVSACCVCVFNHCRTPTASLQLNFLAPKPTLTRKPMKTQTGLSISLPRSWTHPALKSSGLLAQVSQSAVSTKLMLFGCTTALMYHSDSQIFTPPTGTQLHGSYIDCTIAEQGKKVYCNECAGCSR